MTIRKRGFRALVLGLLVTAGLALAPSAFAGGHVSIGINLPGVSLGYWGGHHGHGYVDVGVGGYYGGYGGGYYGNYYAPAYSGGYYGPSYYSGYYAPAPVYYGGYYPAPVYRTYYRSRTYYRNEGPRYDRGYDRGYDNDRGYYRAGYNRGNSCASADPRYCR
ncbi:MAG: hypothetical protein JSS13_11650 [Proteobacteria bacterium]|nr:hypothetical protein [Pseudomonadota bacterium]